MVSSTLLRVLNLIKVVTLPVLSTSNIYSISVKCVHTSKVILTVIVGTITDNDVEFLILQCKGAKNIL